VTGSDGMCQYHQPDDSLPEESIIPMKACARRKRFMGGRRNVVGGSWILCAGVHSNDREAFVLYTLEGFTVDEFPVLRVVPQSQVRQSIQDAARPIFSIKLPTQNQLRKSLLHHSRLRNKKAFIRDPAK